MGIFSGNRTSLNEEEVTIDEMYTNSWSPVELIFESYQNDMIFFDNIIQTDLLEAALVSLNESSDKSSDNTKEGLLNKIWNAILKLIESIKKKIFSIIEGFKRKILSMKLTLSDKFIKDNMDKFIKTDLSDVQLEKPVNIPKDGNDLIKDINQLDKVKILFSLDKYKGKTVEEINNTAEDRKKIELNAYAMLMGKSSSDELTVEELKEEVDKLFFNEEDNTPFTEENKKIIYNYLSSTQNIGFFTMTSVINFEKAAKIWFKEEETQVKQMMREAKKDKANKDDKIACANACRELISSGERVFAVYSNTLMSAYFKLYTITLSLFKAGVKAANSSNKEESQNASYQFLTTDDVFNESVIECEMLFDL